MKMKNTILSSLLIILVGFSAYAERYKYEKTDNNKRGGGTSTGVVANCTPPTASAELDINNVRALIQSGGDMWWDFNRSRYEVPQGSGKTSLFAGSLWLAGQDVSGQFKVAALRFRQIGYDYWTGPLSTVDAEIDPATCKVYDRHWETTRAMVTEFSAWWKAGQFDQQNGTNTQEELYPGYVMPAVISEWPAHGRNFEPYNEDYFLAPFYDNNGDGEYNAEEDGDYPGYVLKGKSDCSRRVRDIYGDQNIWWVFNDKGNIHSESGGQSIGMEIRAQAFSFATTDEVNNMTFYNYELINRSTFELADTYFGQWADGDLGNSQDDYVGVDVRRGLGYFYNGDDNDEDASGNLGYGAAPPAVGIDFFQGPFQANDNRDNCLCENDYAAAKAEDGIVYAGQGAGYGDGIVDNERYGMRKFLYHNNAQSPTGDPAISTDYYNMLRGIWKDGTPMTYGGDGYNPDDKNAIPAHYMFPGDTDPLNWGTNGVDPGKGLWTEVSAGNPPGDRRFLQSSGPFTLGPGAVNNITVGIVWMQAASGGRLQSVAEMRKADDKTQALFDSCFEILDGPHAPDIAIQELDREIIIMLSNPVNSNNYKESYATVDPFLAAPDSVDTDGDGKNDTRLTNEEKTAFATYRFEGYQVYQLFDASVGTNDLNDPDKARLIAQVDIRNDIDRLINYEFDSQLGADVPKLKVDGVNEGISHSFRVTEDRFATGDARLINHKTYYFMAIAYAYNRLGDGLGNLRYIDGTYDPSADPPRLEGQKMPYLASRTSASGPVRVQTAIPHKTEIEMNGIQLNAQYGDGVELIRIEGRGNSGDPTNIHTESVQNLMTSGPATETWTVSNLKFNAGQGPVTVKVVDPLVIPPGDFFLAFKYTDPQHSLEQLRWTLYGDGIGPVESEQTIQYRNEQVITDLGLSVTTAYAHPGTDPGAIANGCIGSDVEFEDETDHWLIGLVDTDNDQYYNWIKSGTYVKSATLGSSTKDFAQDDQFTNFEKQKLKFLPNDPDTILPMDTAHALDPDQDWENIAGRTWAPFALASYDTAHPVPLFSKPGGGTYYELSELILKNAKLAHTPSVDVYITADKSKWTRCPVLEAQDNALLTQGNAVRGELRRGLSVDKEGRNQMDPGCNQDEATYGGTQVIGDMVTHLRQQDKDYFASLGFTSEGQLRQLSFGMGWFPGYAMDAETGERLNMAFAEDSWLKSENGNDMLWNPTSTIVEPLFKELRLGGKHMIYVFRSNTEDASFGADNMMPAYDGGNFSFERLIAWDPTVFLNLIDPGNSIRKGYLALMGSCAWVGYPLLALGAQLFGNSGDGNDVVFRLRSARPFRPYAVDNLETDPAVTPGNTYYIYEGSLSTTQKTVDTSGNEVTHTAVLVRGQTFTAVENNYTQLTEHVRLAETINEGLPLYLFNTRDLAPTVDVAIGRDALEEIRAVPNPYYAYSTYETGRLDNRVKIINLPEECTVSIFTVNGTLVRIYKKSDPSITSIDWDLKNQDNIPIASGIYIIHIHAPDIGEKVIKWFGVIRPIDLNSF